MVKGLLFPSPNNNDITKCPPTDRILELARYCKFKKLKGIDSDRAFLQACGINDTSLLAGIRSEKVKNPGVLVIEKICNKTGCNANWLVTGKGEMFAGKKGMDVAGLKRKLNEALEMLR